MSDRRRPLPPPFDAGLQPERTALAWRRTTLALAVGCLVGIRILGHALGPWATIPAGVGLVAAIVLTVVAHRRHRAIAHALVDGDGVLPDGRMAALVAAVAVLCGFGALGFVLA